jgi:myo-inositol 2-dehydrogenase/D-chiro-inositol 1-dehydrogenase
MSDQANLNQPAKDDSSQPSRRDFLKHSTAAVAGTTLAATLGINRMAHASVDDTMRVALIGCGGRGGGAVQDAFKSGANVKLVAMADAFEDRLTNKLKTFGEELVEFKDRIDVPKDRQFTGFDAYQKALDSGVDMVILATPPGFRPVHFEAAVKANKHVFMEKPVAVDAPGIRRVLAAAKEADAKKLGVGVGLQRRHQANYIETIKRLQEGAIGDILYTRAYWNGSTPWVNPRKDGQTEMEYQMRNWYYFNWLCGDHIVEQHIHNLDVINWLKNSHPVKANGMGGRQVRVGKDYGETFDHHFVEFEYDDGTRMYSQCRHIEGCMNRVNEYAHGTKGNSVIGDASITGENPFRFRANYTNPYVQEHIDLHAAIRSGAPYNEAEMGAISTMTAIFGRMATYCGKEITWDEAINSEIDFTPKELAWDALPQVLPGDNGMYPCAIPGITSIA